MARKEFIVATETGLVSLMRLRYPNKIFHEALPNAICIQMKKNNLNLVLESLENEEFEISVPKEISDKAKVALERMLELK